MTNENQDTNSKPFELLHGDCLHLMKSIPDNSVDMILTDLPYGCTDAWWDQQLPLYTLWDQYRRIIRDGGVVAMFAKQSFTLELGMSNLKAFKYKLVWAKNQGTDFFNSNRKPLAAHEDVLIFVPKGGKPIYNKIMRTGFEPYHKKPAKSGGVTSINWKLNKGNYSFNPNLERINDGTRCPVDVLEFPVVKDAGHSTAKPVALCEWLIRTYTNEGMTVLDSCMGSGTTGIACINTGRKFIGMELTQEFYEHATKRVHEAYTKHQSLLDGLRDTAEACQGENSDEAC